MGARCHWGWRQGWHRGCAAAPAHLDAIPGCSWANPAGSTAVTLPTPGDTARLSSARAGHGLSPPGAPAAPSTALPWAPPGLGDLGSASPAGRGHEGPAGQDRRGHLPTEGCHPSEWDEDTGVTAGCAAPQDNPHLPPGEVSAFPWSIPAGKCSLELPPGWEGMEHQGVVGTRAVLGVSPRCCWTIGSRGLAGHRRGMEGSAGLHLPVHAKGISSLRHSRTQPWDLSPNALGESSAG